MSLAGSTVRRFHTCLAMILDTAVKDGLIPSNPARGVKLPRRAEPRRVYLTAQQVKFLTDHCTRHRELVWLLATTGLRWSEAVALRAGDIDQARRRIRVERAAVTVGSTVHVGTPKTHEKRTVAAPAFVMDMLAPLMKGKSPDALLWTNSTGGYMQLPTHHSWFYGAVKRAMSDDPSFPYVTVHGLRHVAAGLLVSQGANVKVVQRQLGHAQASMTLDVYADLFEGDLDDVAFRGLV
ncbi:MULTISPECIES: site-specific integrase [Corynebacterium]|uniref:tyrosine-type recombinase/integrase n=1 Tax=Corynebacterium TaxID=1716 RepID=UPI001FD33B2F|nr:MULTISPECIES: site-specific integrase [Corynebacterium]